MTYTIRKDAGKYQIDKKAAFCELLSRKLPLNAKKITELLDDFDRKVREDFPGTTQNALNNCHGDWYEWIIAICAWNLYARSNSKTLVLKTPNITKFDVSRFYIDRFYDLIADLRKKVSETTSVQLITSNPDFVIINPAGLKVPLNLKKPIEEITPEVLVMIDDAYKAFTGICSIENVIGYISAKTSFRPDRRLQIPHEGSLMKALYAHIATREWNRNLKGLKYYAIATEVKPPDEKALRTLATHSIVNVQTTPEAAVDAVFSANSLNDLERAFGRILS